MYDGNPGEIDFGSSSSGRLARVRVIGGRLYYHIPFSLGGHVESQQNKKLCYCTASLAHTWIQCEACRAKTKLFILLRLNMAAEWERSIASLTILTLWQRNLKTWIIVVTCLSTSYFAESDHVYLRYCWPTLSTDTRLICRLSIGRYNDRCSIDTRPILELYSADTRSIYRPSIGLRES